MMGAFLYGTALQWRLDIRSRTLLITCYVVPLLFFAMMGGIFTSVNPSARETLVPSRRVEGFLHRSTRPRGKRWFRP